MPSIPMFGRAWDRKIRLLAGRRPGEPHPFDVGRDAVPRYFKVFDECAQVARLKLVTK